MKKIFTLTFFLCSISSLWAQQPAEELQAEFEKFVDAYATILTHRDTDKVLDFVSLDLKSTVLSTDIRDKVKIVHNNFEGFEDFLDKVIHTDQLTLHYDVKDIIKVAVNGNSGLVVYEVAYEINEVGKLWTKGTEIVNISYKKIHGKWTIVYFTVVSVEDEKYKGLCYCKLFEAKDNHYVMMTQEPEGKEYKEHLTTFDFKRVGVEHQLIRTEKDTYRWLETTGGVWHVTTGTKDEVKLGEAKNVKAVMLVILKNHIFQDHCGTLKVRK